MASILHDRRAVKAAIEISSSKKEVLVNLGLRAAGGNYKALDNACLSHGLELPKWKPTTSFTERIPIEDILVENSSYSRSHLKKRLIQEKILPELCIECGSGTIWNGKPLSLQLEHKNGIHDDNRLENLCFLCPNCHTQTLTYAGRSNQGKGAKHSSICVDCGSAKGRNNLRCRPCGQKRAHREGKFPTKIEWPDKLDLQRRVDDSSYAAVARELGVSDNAVRKRLRSKKDSYASTTSYRSTS